MYKIFFLAAIIGTLKSNDHNLASYEDRSDINECVMVFEAAGGQVSDFEGHSIIKCERQIVNGNNYRLTLVDQDHNIKKCKMVIYQSFNKLDTKALKHREPENDCFTLLDNDIMASDGL